MLGRIVGYVCACALLTTVALPGYISRKHHDPPDADDADLNVALLDVSYEENALSYLLEAAAVSQWNERDSMLLLSMRAGDRWSPGDVEALLARNRAAVKKLEMALAAPHFRLREMSSIDPEVSPEIPLDTRHLVSILEMRARLASRRGDLAGAFAAAHEILRLAQRIEEANGAVLSTTMLSVAFRGIGLDVIRTINATAEPDLARARSWVDALDDYRSNPVAWKRMWAAEYQQWKRLLHFISDQLASDDLANRSPRPIEIASAGPSLRALASASTGTNRLVGAIRSHPTETLALFAEMTRSYQRASERACSELDDLPGLAERSLSVGSLRGTVDVPPQVVAIEAPDYREFFLKRCAEDSALSATQVLIALKAYQRDHQALPDTLDQLVPRYLEGVPLDAFDGRPIRYSSDRARVYSIGSDGRDAGGVMAEGAEPFSEPSYPVEF